MYTTDLLWYTYVSTVLYAYMLHIHQSSEKEC